MCRPLAEGLRKDKLPGLPVFATALRCLPYILPDAWDASRIAAELPGVWALPCQPRSIHALLQGTQHKGMHLEGACICSGLMH